MKLSGIHLLLTYRCDSECEHCFVWGSPKQIGTMTLQDIERILEQARDTGTVRWIYFEGGEPFLYYPILLAGVRMAARMGFHTGIVSNSYWATSEADAMEWLRPFAGLLQDLSVSSDLYHASQMLSPEAAQAQGAARRLGIPVGVITICQPETHEAHPSFGQLPPGESALMYRGRAAETLAGRAPQRPWSEFTACPYEDLREPGRLHVDPFGHLHICQGISVGNLFRTPLRDICQDYDATAHPITGPLLVGGPAELVRHYQLAHQDSYADACHLCYSARHILHQRFPD
ncbi:MAG: radical SAM protein, partial [Chloroflexi bacterium]|nr:radical SAM protein [Chloroflexota bacterium]